MRLSRQAALAIALVAGLLAALFAWMFIGQQHKPKVEAPTTVQIPVPIKNIPVGVELQPEMFSTIEQPQNQVTPSTATDAQMLAGRIAVTELPEGQPVRLEQVQERSARLGMAYALNEGLRGMAVSLDVIGAVGDFVKPYDHVDVLTALKEDGQVIVRTLVQDVVVLAIGQTISSAPPTAAEETSETKQEPAAPRRIETPVTLALTPSQAQVIMTADQAGDLRLTLRAKNDRSVIPLPAANSWSMIGAVPKQQPGGGTQPAARASATGATPQPGVQPVTVTGAVTGGISGGRSTVAAARPKKPYVEVVRGDEHEYVVP